MHLTTGFATTLSGSSHWVEHVGFQKKALEIGVILIDSAEGGAQHKLGIVNYLVITMIAVEQNFQLDDRHKSIKLQNVRESRERVCPVQGHSVL